MNGIFLPMFIQGLAGMSAPPLRRRRAVRPRPAGAALERVHLVSAWGLALAQIPFIFNFFWSMQAGQGRGREPLGGDHARVGRAVAAAARQLRAPRRRVYRGPYEYSVPGHADATSRRSSSRHAAASCRERTAHERTDDDGDHPYTVEARPDTGLNNGKLGIWLFLASEVMLFGALFASYIMLRIGAPTWPRGSSA